MTELSDREEAEQEFHHRQELAEGEEDPALREYREAARKEMEKLSKRFEDKFVTPLIELRMLPTDCLLFVNGCGWMIGCHCQKDLVKRHGGDPVTKSNVSKYVKTYKRRLQVPAVAGQRDESACKKMKLARKDQLKP